MSVNVNKAIKYSLAKAEEHFIKKNYGRAFAHYILSLEIKSETSQDDQDLMLFDFESKLVKVAALWCCELEASEQIQKVRYCYNKLLANYPHNVLLLNQLAAHYQRCNETRLAIKYFEIAHAINPEHLPSEKNLQSMYASKLPQWHFRMLNDKQRNEKYKLAIEKLITGEISIANENSFNIIDIGTGTGLLSLFASKFQVEKNVKITAVESCQLMAQIAHKIFSFNLHNSKVKINLLETQSLDISTDRIYNLLITEIFDCCLFGEGVLSTLMHAHEELLTEDAQVLPHSAKLFIFGVESHQLDNKYRFNNKFNGLKMPDCIRKLNEHNETYDAFNLNSFEYKQITEVQEIVSVNFNNVEQLEQLFLDQDAIPEVELSFIEVGTCHALIICFDLLLDKEGIHQISTNPLNSHKENFCDCWEQGVFFMKHLVTNTNTDESDNSKKLKLKISTCINKLEIKLFNESENHIENCHFVTQEAIALLNFDKLLETYEEIINKLQLDHFPEKVLDLSVLPIFGLLILKKAKILGLENKIKVFCRVKQENLPFTQKILELNSEINQENLIFDFEHSFIDSENKFDLIIYEPMLENGLLNENVYANIEQFKKALSPKGIFLPSEVNLCFNVVESDYLEKCTRANDENLFGYNIASQINAYSVNEMRNLTEVDHKSLSAIVKMPILRHENAHEQTISVPIQEGTVNGFIYWFEMLFSGGLSVSTLKTTYNQGAFVQDKDKVSQVNECLDIRIKQDQGLLKIFV